MRKTTKTRFAAALLAASLIAPQAGAQNETVKIETEALNPLVGAWRVQRLLISRDGHWYKEPQRDIYCMIDQTARTLTVRCFGSGRGDLGISVTPEAAFIKMGFGSSGARALFSGKFLSITEFEGKWTIQGRNVLREASVVSRGTRIDLSQPIPDTAGKTPLLRRLLEEMRKGPLKEQVLGKGSLLYQPMTPDVLRKLGEIRVVNYLGIAEEVGTSGGAEWYVYNVGFDNGQHVCGLHDRADGVLERFVCI